MTTPLIFGGPEYTGPGVGVKFFGGDCEKNRKVDSRVFHPAQRVYWRMLRINRTINAADLTAIYRIMLIVGLIAVGCQQQNGGIQKKSDRSQLPAIEKNLGDVWTEFDPNVHPGQTLSEAITDVFLLPAGGMKVATGRPLRIAEIELLFESSDRYRLELWSGDSLVYRTLLTSPISVSPNDLYPAHIVTPDSVLRRPCDLIWILPDSGDGHFRAGHLDVVSND